MLLYRSVIMQLKNPAKSAATLIGIHVSFSVRLAWRSLPLDALFLLRFLRL